MSFLNPKNFFFEEKKTDFWRNIKTILDKKIPWPSSSRYTTRIMQEKKNGVFPTIWGFKEPPPPPSVRKHFRNLFRRKVLLPCFIPLIVARALKSDEPMQSSV